MLNKDTARTIIDTLIAETKNHAVVYIDEDVQETTRFANSEINQNVSIADTTVRLTLFDGKKEATCATNVLTGDGLRKLVRDTEAMLPYIPEGEFGAFTVSQELLPETVNDERLTLKFDAKGRADAVKRGVDRMSDGFTAAGALALNRKSIAYGDSNGTFRFAAYDGVSFNTVVTHTDGAAGGGDCISYTSDDFDTDEAFNKALATAQAARNPVSIETGAYTVVLSPLAFGELLSYATMLLNAKLVDDGISFAVGKLGERVFGENFTVRDDVAFPGTRPLYFDCEGNKRQSFTLIENGVVQNLLYDNKVATRVQRSSTGHAVTNTGYGGYPFNAVMQGKDGTLNDIIAGTSKGLFINEFHYVNFVNPRTLQMTGLTRNGAFLIDNGVLGNPITTMRFTQDMIQAFNQITAISSDCSKISQMDAIYIMPSVRIEGFHFTSKQ